MTSARQSLAGPGFRFRSLRLDDHAPLAAAAADERYWQFLPEGPRTSDEVLAFLRDVTADSSEALGDQKWWAIEGPEDGQFLGTANLKRIGAEEDRCCSAGCTVVPGAQGLGIGRQVGLAIIRVAFVDYGMHRVECTCAEDNERSCHMMGEVLGLTYEGLRRAHKKTPRGWWSSHVYSVLADEFPALEKRIAEKL